jgi:glyceraldehyde 3-phosphate dehydrogenase
MCVLQMSFPEHDLLWLHNFNFNTFLSAGRLVLRLAWDKPDVYNVVTMNDIAAAESIAYLLQYDSIHGTWKCNVECGEDGTITISEGDRVQKIKYTQEKDITKVSLPMLKF